MRTVITHFYNEEYLLPWWLNHHVKIFDHGILINHSSTDNSVDICREIAPHWKLVDSKLTSFDAWLNDFEVMSYEMDVIGWKIALNITEFIIATPGFDEVEKFILDNKKAGIAATGMTMIDKLPSQEISTAKSLVRQKPWAIEENKYDRKWMRRLFRYPLGSPMRNRFYHCLPNGMYSPGRHSSHHPDGRWRTPNLMLLHYAYAPWTKSFIARKMQIAAKIPESDKSRGWGAQHLRGLSQLESDFNVANDYSFIDLRRHEFGAHAIGIKGAQPAREIVQLKNKG